MNDKYLQYSLQDYLTDDGFVSAFKEGKINPEEWEEKLSGDTHAIEVFMQAVSMLNSLKFKATTLPGERINSLWENVRNDVEDAKANAGKLRRLSAVTGIAASIILLFSLVWLFIGQNKQISAYPGEQVEYILPDNSKIDLNAHSYIRFNKKKFSETRTLELSGEARFQVNKGEKFSVQTSNGTVRVLGTIFNVFDRDSIFEVQCFEGEVLAITANNDSSLLNANMGIRFNSVTDEITLYSIDSEARRSWVDDKFKFINSPFSMVLSELQLQFNIQLIEEQGLQYDTRFYTGSFSNKDLETALQSVLWPMHFEYKIMGKQVIITAQ